MSTPCQIGLYENNKRTVLIYGHSDGYPDGKNGILNILVPLVKDFIKNRGYYDAMFLSAQIVYKLIENSHNQDYFKDENKYSGFGISQNIVAIEYFYKIDEFGIEVFETPDPWDQDSWKSVKTIYYYGGS